MLITDAVLPGEVFAPIHWTGEPAPSARIDVVVALSRFQPSWHGFAISMKQMQPTTDYWAMSRTNSGGRAELAGQQAPEDRAAYARAMVGAFFASPDTLPLARDHLAQLPGRVDGVAVRFDPARGRVMNQPSRKMSYIRGATIRPTAIGPIVLRGLIA